MNVDATVPFDSRLGLRDKVQRSEAGTVNALISKGSVVHLNRQRFISAAIFARQCITCEIDRNGQAKRLCR